MMTLDEAREHIGHAVIYLPKGGIPEGGVIADVTRRTVFVRYSGETSGAKATDPADLVLATDFARTVLHFTRTWAELAASLPDDYGCEMNCAEANAAAELWEAAGDPRAAAEIVAVHAAHDEDGDEHWEAAQAAGTEVTS